MLSRRPVLATLLLIAAAAPALRAGEVLPPPSFATPVAFEFDSGVIHNPSLYPTRAHTTIVQWPRASSVRVFFREVDLDSDSALIVTSLRDGYQHVMTQAELIKWRHSTAFFNGDAVQIDLHLAPGSRGSYRIDRLLAGTTAFALYTVCGTTDDRVSSTDNRSVRMLDDFGSNACSGWLASANSCVLSAGHCFPGNAAVAQVNVPPSNPNGSFNHPRPHDQYPVDPLSLAWENGGLGNDWAMAKLLPNSSGQTAANRYGFFPLAAAPVPLGTVVRVTGYGTDKGRQNQINQTHTGPLVAQNLQFEDILVGTPYSYQVDTTEGSSGSVVYDDASGEAIAIHTHGGCTVAGGGNGGTRLIDNPAFQDAFAERCVTTAPTSPRAQFDVGAEVIVVGQPVYFTDASLGVPSQWSWDFDQDGVADSNQPNPSFNYPVAGTYDVTLTVKNGLGSDVLTVVDAVTVLDPSPVTLPHTESFDSGLPSPGKWRFSSDLAGGLIAAGQSGPASPGSGGDGLLLGTNLQGPAVVNEAALYFRHPGGQVSLTYWFKSLKDEPDFNDGVFLSDGVSEVLMLSHQNLPTNWVKLTVDVDQAAFGAGFAPGELLSIIFRQQDNFPIPDDGHAIDDVQLTGPPPFTATPTALSASAGGVVTLAVDAGSANSGLVYLIAGSVSGTAPGFVTSGFHIPLNPDPWMLLTVTQPNTAPLSKFLSVTDPLGKASATITLPPGSSALAGLTFDHVYATSTLAGQIKAVSQVATFTVTP